MSEQKKQEAKQYASAEEKLDAELAHAADKSFAEPVIGYLKKRCAEDTGMAEDVMQEHKTWAKCFNHIYSQAKKQAKGNAAAIRDEVVYEWAEDYYHLDDKALEEKKAKGAAEQAKQRKEVNKAVMNAPTTAPKISAKKKADKKAGSEKPAKEKKSKSGAQEVDGQMDIFSFLGE
ncbi:MAG: PcfK-like family protein [Lachnospiraceae bacterium]|nr:PcfK-like family protein [Lachnospiraceae bacterium]